MMDSRRSPYAAQRNAGLPSIVQKSPEYAALLPGYVNPSVRDGVNPGRCSRRSPYVAQRNAGQPLVDHQFPECAALLPGYVNPSFPAMA